MKPVHLLLAGLVFLGASGLGRAQLIADPDTPTTDETKPDDPGITNDSDTPVKMPPPMPSSNEDGETPSIIFYSMSGLPAAEAPEPASWVLLGVGGLGLAIWKRRSAARA